MKRTTSRLIGEVLQDPKLCVHVQLPITGGTVLGAGLEPDFVTRLGFGIGRAELPGAHVEKGTRTRLVELMGPLVSAAANGNRLYIANRVLNTL
jgi:hypothetical protein